MTDYYKLGHVYKSDKYNIKFKYIDFTDDNCDIVLVKFYKNYDKNVIGKHLYTRFYRNSTSPDYSWEGNKLILREFIKEEQIKDNDKLIV